MWTPGIKTNVSESSSRARGPLPRAQRERAGAAGSPLAPSITTWHAGQYLAQDVLFSTVLAARRAAAAAKRFGDPQQGPFTEVSTPSWIPSQGAAIPVEQGQVTGPMTPKLSLGSPHCGAENKGQAQTTRRAECEPSSCRQSQARGVQSPGLATGLSQVRSKQVWDLGLGTGRNRYSLLPSDLWILWYLPADN